MRYEAYAADDGAPKSAGKPPTDVLLAAFWSTPIPGTSADGGFAPAQMEVMPVSSARGDLPARVCLLGADRMSYKVYALPPESEMLRS